MVSAEDDAYGEELKSFVACGHATEIVERNDGYINAHDGIPMYFAPFDEWSELEKEAMTFVRGRVLDVGAGAGRVALHAQSRGQQCVAIDNSPGAVEVCRDRGVEDARLLPFSRIDDSVAPVDSVVMLGNNFGLFAGYCRARWLLRRLKRLTTENARIVAQTTDPYATDNADHLQYHERNRRQGRMGGQLRIRVRHRHFVGPWFDYLLACPDELRQILRDTGWSVETLLPGNGPSYVAVIHRA